MLECASVSDCLLVCVCVSIYGCVCACVCFIVYPDTYTVCLTAKQIEICEMYS